MKYGIVWQAVFKDGSVINQFDGDIENKFKLVLDRQDTLQVFCLLNINTGQKYTLCLKTGIISIGDNPFEQDQIRREEYRLIYFRRVEKDFTLGEDIPNEPTRISYFLGCQYTDEKGVNHKKLMQIYDDNRIVVY